MLSRFSLVFYKDFPRFLRAAHLSFLLSQGGWLYLCRWNGLRVEVTQASQARLSSFCEKLSLIEGGSASSCRRWRNDAHIV